MNAYGRLSQEAKRKRPRTVETPPCKQEDFQKKQEQEDAGEIHTKGGDGLLEKSQN